MKARIKNYEDMPAYVSCCNAAVKSMLPTCGIMIDVVPSNSTHPIKCPKCGSIYPVVPSCSLIRYPNARIPAECIYIDEGEAN